MNLKDLKKLHAALEFLLRQKSFLNKVEQLKLDLSRSNEPFVWSTVALNTIERELPTSIKSCWIFVLKKDVASGCHYHPNSIQHMIAINGKGQSKVGGNRRKMIPFGSPNYSVTDKWYVIGQGVPHEFFPAREDMTVVSFHTCEHTNWKRSLARLGKHDCTKVRMPEESASLMPNKALQFERWAS
jgi:hypothetical protein